MENTDITLEEEVNTTQTETTPADVQAQPENKEETIGDIRKDIEADDKKIGLDKFLAEKKQRKEIERENKALKDALTELQSKAQSGATKAEVSENLMSIAAEYDIDQNFLKKLVNVVRTETSEEFEAKISPKLAKLEEKERREEFEGKFNKYFSQTMERLPELDGIVNKEVIKQLAQNPSNANKTITQLVEETYGGAITGKRTFEKTTPNGGKEPEKVDFDRARKDSDYFKQVMADPALKKEYNESLHKRIRL
jgi:hypothetical protein